MKDLIELWERRAEKYHKLGRDAIDELKAEGLFAMAEAYGVCANELRRKLKEK